MTPKVHLYFTFCPLVLPPGLSSSPAKTLLRGEEEKQGKLEFSAEKMQVQLPGITISVMMSIDFKCHNRLFFIILYDRLVKSEIPGVGVRGIMSFKSLYIK